MEYLTLNNGVQIPFDFVLTTDEMDQLPALDKNKLKHQN